MSIVKEEYKMKILEYGRMEKFRGSRSVDCYKFRSIGVQKFKKFWRNIKYSKKIEKIEYRMQQVEG